jgi:hypothetical protein
MKAQVAQDEKNLAEALILEHAGACPTFRVNENLVSIPRHNLSNSSKPAAASINMSIQNLLNDRPKTQIGVAHNARTHPRWSVVEAGAHCCDAVGELRFTNRTECFRTIATMHRPALDEHRGDYTMTGSHVLQQFVKEIPPAGAIPKVMVAVNDGKVRFDCGFRMKS